jgi:hypothetical protein
LNIYRKVLCGMHCIVDFSHFFFKAVYIWIEGFLSTCAWNRQRVVTSSLQHIWSTLTLVMLINHTFILSNLLTDGVMCQTNEFLPFMDLFDINVLRRAYGPSYCRSPGEVDESIRNHRPCESDSYRFLREFEGNKSQWIAYKNIKVCRAPFDFLVKANITSVYETTQPHPSLKMILIMNKHPSTSFDKLWLQHKNHEVKSVLYLAGGDRKDRKPFFMNTD